MKRVLRIAAVVLVVLVAVHVVATLVLSSRYEAELERIRAAGLPVLPRDLATEPVPDEENLAVGLREASEWLARHHETHPEPMELFELWREERFDTEERDALQSYLRSIEPYLDRVEAALARPAYHLDVDWDAGPAMALPLISQLQEATEGFANWAIYLDEPTTRTDRIVRAARACRGLGERCCLPFVIGHFVQETARADVVTLVCESRARSGFDAVRLRTALDPLLREEAHGSSARALAEERTIGVWAFERWRAGESVSLGLPRNEWIESVEGTYLARPLMYLDALRYFDLLQQGIDSCDVTPAAALAAGASPATAEESDLPSPITKLWAPLPARVRAVYGNTAASLRLCRVALALMAHRQTTGAWPATLAELGDLPTDPYSGGAFRYEVGDASVRLWCTRDSEWWLLVDMELAWEWKRE